MAALGTGGGLMGGAAAAVAMVAVGLPEKNENTGENILSSMRRLGLGGCAAAVAAAEPVAAAPAAGSCSSSTLWNCSVRAGESSPAAAFLRIDAAAARAAWAAGGTWKQGTAGISMEEMLEGEETSLASAFGNQIQNAFWPLFRWLTKHRDVA